MSTSTLHRKLLSLIAARAAVISVLLGSAVLIQIKSPGSLPIDPFFFLLGLTFGLTVVYSLTIHYAEKYRWLVDLQLVGDALIVSALVHVTGGINSYFSSLYALPIVAASWVRSWRGGMIVGTAGSGLYAAIVLAQYFGSPPPDVVESLPVFREALYRGGLNIFGFFAVAALTGYLAEGLRRADAQLQRASTALADMQAFSRHVVDSLTSGLATTDTEGMVITFNRAAEAITGIRAVDAIGRGAASVLQLPASLDGLFGPVDGRPRQTRVEFTFSRTDGRPIEVGLSAAPLMTPRGETGFILTFQDVTESRRQEREARVQQRLAAVGEMAAGIAHEIRNPLASMSGSIQILRQELPLTEEQGQLMDIVIRESERLNDTIRSFLSYARPQRQSMTHMDVRQIITDTATLLQNSAERSDSHRIAVDVPPAPVLFQADEGQIRQIVWNLATNGLRAMPGGGQLTLSVTPPTPAAPDVTFGVSDEGVGIAAEEIDGIFQPFRGGFSRGTGLGLSIVHRIVSDYAGEVKVTSARGTGTTVHVRFPVAEMVKEEVGR
ncbi:MAG: two-component system sensor histidine kinase NtrB [Vicinamibacterales bacterium]